jgi:hypothetical protein
MKSRFLLLCFVLLFGSTGCAFAGIGAGIGAAVPKTETVTTPEADAPVDLRSDDKTIASGKWVGEENGDVLVRHHDEVLHVEKARVAEIRKRTGSHWLTGFLIGGAADVILGGVLTVLAVRSFGSGLSAMGGM